MASALSFRDARRHARAHFTNPAEPRGLLIAFEGPDGSGKTTQRKLFKKWLEAEDHDVEFVGSDQADHQAAQERAGAEPRRVLAAARRRFPAPRGASDHSRAVA